MSIKTGLLDVDGVEIQDGDYLPNGWTFDDDDVYQVYFDERIQNWSLRLNVEPDSPLNIKYMNHAVSLLHDGSVRIRTLNNQI